MMDSRQFKAGLRNRNRIESRISYQPRIARSNDRFRASRSPKPTVSFRPEPAIGSIAASAPICLRGVATVLVGSSSFDSDDSVDTGLLYRGCTVRSVGLAEHE